jgi:hypothetical protein
VSDSPCSVPAWLRPLVPEEHELFKACCRRHDGKYEAGGTERERLIADVEFLLDMLQAGISESWAFAYFYAVRHAGASHWANKEPCRLPDLAPYPVESP